MIKNFIFDIDGTLIDTEAMYMLSLQDVLVKHGIDRPYSDLTATFGIPSLDALKRLEIPADLIPEITDEWVKQVPQHQDQVKIFPGIETGLAQLKAKPNTELAIMTSKKKFEFERDIEPLGLDQYFSEFVFAEDVKRGKPAPDPIILAVKRMGAVNEETVYVGDTPYDLEAAHAADVSFALVAWGDNPHAKTLKGAEYILEKPTDLLQL